MTCAPYNKGVCKYLIQDVLTPILPLFADNASISSRSQFWQKSVPFLAKPRMEGWSISAVPMVSGMRCFNLKLLLNNIWSYCSRTGLCISLGFEVKHLWWFTGVPRLWGYPDLGWSRHFLQLQASKHIMYTVHKQYSPELGCLGQKRNPSGCWHIEEDFDLSTSLHDQVRVPAVTWMIFPRTQQALLDAFDLQHPTPKPRVTYGKVPSEQLLLR
jgi:hypothetical protein